MTRPAGPYRAKILGLASALARERGWPLALSPRSRHLRVTATARIGLQARGCVVVATATFALDPDAVIDTPDDLARAIAAGLADAALAVAPPHVKGGHYAK